MNAHVKLPFVDESTEMSIPFNVFNPLGEEPGVEFETTIVVVTPLERYKVIFESSALKSKSSGVFAVTAFVSFPDFSQSSV